MSGTGRSEREREREGHVGPSRDPTGLQPHDKAENAARTHTPMGPGPLPTTWRTFPGKSEPTGKGTRWNSGNRSLGLCCGGDELVRGCIAGPLLGPSVEFRLWANERMFLRAPFWKEIPLA